MASLLGGQFCMESLQTDVRDLQSAVNDVFSRVGPVRYPSWKYPDKMSCDLDVDELLEFHGYSAENSAEERQMSHVVLYELVIDRLVLLLQGMTKYSEQMLLSGKSPVGADPPSHTSLGLVVKKYWRRIVQLHALSTQLNSECRSKERKINELQDSAHNTSDESIKCREGGSVSSQIGFGGLIPPSSAEIHSVMGSPISHDCCHKSSQTLETAFVPCESCLCVQKNMKDTGECVVNMCHSQGLPSSLHKFRPHVVNNDWLTANEVSQWNSEQMKDLNRVSKHLEHLFSTSENLKSELKQLDIKCAKLQDKAEKADKEVKVEKETQRGMSVQFEAKVSSLKSEHCENLARVKEEKSNLEKNRIQMEEQLQKYQDELTRQKKLLERLKETQCVLEQELQSTRSEAVSAESLQSTVDRLTSEVDHITQQLQSANSQLSKEQTKSKSAAKHSQSLQNKQGTLLQQLESLGQENEELKGQVSDLEEAKEALEADLQTSKQQLEQLQAQALEDKEIMTQLREEKCELEKSIRGTEQCLEALEAKLTESREQQRLLAEFPDLNGPVNHNVQGTGDIMKDMERQIDANSLRIRLLEEQNDAFRNSIRKMLESRDGSRPLPQPVPLWKQSGLDTLTESPESHRAGTIQYKAEWSVPADGRTKFQNIDNGNQKASPSLKSASSSSMTKTDETFLIGRSMRPDSGSRGRNSRTPQRPSSGNKEGRNNKVVAPTNPSLSVYKQLKNSGKVGSVGPRNYGRDVPETSSYLPSDVFTCAQCDKIYSNKRDLDIHKSYCTG